jgi:methionyl-tRNA synthetase
MKPSYYVTTPIYYANGHPHLGNTYTTTLADMLTRFYAYLGYDTFSLTGTDEHGDKVHQAATAAGKTPQEFTDEVSEDFKKTWKELGLTYSRFIRTTEEEHKNVVKGILQKLYDQGDIYFGEYGGNYCVGCERFLTDKELVDGKCPDHQVEPKYVSEKNYFFKMTKYRDQLLNHITNVQPDFIRPERYKNEVVSMIKDGLEDLCISRPKSRLTWGIELPFDKDYVAYVWFDALVNYLTGVGYPDGENYQQFWPVCEHLVGKDIIKPHGVFWPTMLMAAGIPLYKHLNVHGYWITPIGKMSKSLGNVVDPIAVKNEYGMDAFRYFIFREMTFGLDGTFSEEAFQTRYNADLANNLGNLVSRTVKMIHLYRGGKVPAVAKEEEKVIALRELSLQTVSRVREHIKKMEINKALEVIWALIDAANVYIERTKPYVIAKSPELSAELDTVLYTLAEVSRFVSVLISAFLPQASEKILTLLGYDDVHQEQLESKLIWGGIKVGQKIKEAEALFPRKETKKKSMETKETIPTTTTIPSSSSTEIAYEEFAKVELKVGQILAAEKIEKSEKLLKLQVDVGDATGPRQIVSGIAKFVAPENLVGKKLVFVTNLKPAKLMGHMSQGMLLAAPDVHGNLELMTVSDALSPGTVVK